MFHDILSRMGNSTDPDQTAREHSGFGLQSYAYAIFHKSSKHFRKSIVLCIVV